MIDDDRKLLTEFLGECWQTAENSWGQDFPCHNRQFDDNWQDFGALVDRLKELGLWDEFLDFAWVRLSFPDDTLDRVYDVFVTYLFHPARCQDIADFLRGRK